MRRKDREINNLEEILAIVEQCKVFRVAMVDQGEPYVVPLNFGYQMNKGILEFYFHSAAKGKKIDLMKQNPKVCIEMDRKHALVVADQACKYGFLYESVIAHGVVHFIEVYEEKVQALIYLMKQQTGEDFTEVRFGTDEVKRVLVGKIIVNSIVAKARKV